MAGPLTELNAETIRSTLSKEMPSHKCVLIGVDGDAKEVIVDMTPSKQEVSKLLGGALTFLGQYEPLGVLVVVVRDGFALPVNAGKLPEPFKETEVHGPIILTRSDENGNPLDFALDEYKEFAAKEPEPWQLETFADGEEDDADDDLDELEEEEEDDDDDDDEYEDAEEDDDDEEEDADLAELLFSSALERFETNNGRPATDVERGRLEAAVSFRLASAASNDDDDDEGNKAEILVIKKICDSFESEHGRAPTPAEVDNILEALRNTEDADEDDDEDDDNESDNVLEELISMFKEKNGRDPTEAEIGQWPETIKSANLNLDDAPLSNEEKEDPQEPPSKRARTSD